MAKKYYWLKLPEDFFSPSNKAIKKLRSVAGGDTYTIIYLKMLLYSLQNEGIILYDGIEDTFAEDIALGIDEDPENVRITISFLAKTGLAEFLSDDELKLTKLGEMIGKESDSAHRVREFRSKKALQCNANVTDCNGDVTICNTEIEIEIEKDIEIEKSEKPTRHKFGSYSNVLLTDEEFEKLAAEFPDDFLARIERLSEYIASTGKRYKSHLATIRSWARQDKEKQAAKKPGNFKGRNYSREAMTELERRLLQAEEKTNG